MLINKMDNRSSYWTILFNELFGWIHQEYCYLLVDVTCVDIM